MGSTDLAGWLARLEQLHPTEIEMGLERVAEVARRLCIGQPEALVFTVTGTNGKGSTCAALEALLTQHGFKVGCYTSPHLLDYNERVRIAGQQATDAQLCQAFEAIDAARADISLTYFEFGTLAALLLFQRANVEALVLEVGLGGRLDAVNIIDPTVAIVTSIGLDHAEFLGNSRDSVGFEKAGIMRPGIKLVCSETDWPVRFESEVQRQSAQVWRRCRDYDWAAEGEGWTLQLRDGAGQARQLCGLPPGDLPKDNLATAVQAVWAAGLELDADLVIRALTGLHSPGRMEQRTISWRGQPRRLLLDVGHNPHAASYLAAQLRARPGDRQAVFGLLADKDLPGVTAPFSGVFESWALAPLPSPRSRPLIELITHLTACGERTEGFDSVAAALEHSLDNTATTTEIVIFGSFFCVSAAILWLNQQTRELTNG